MSTHREKSGPNIMNRVGALSVLYIPTAPQCMRMRVSMLNAFEIGP